MAEWGGGVIGLGTHFAPVMVVKPIVIDVTVGTRLRRKRVRTGGPETPMGIVAPGTLGVLVTGVAGHAIGLQHLAIDLAGRRGISEVRGSSVARNSQTVINRPPIRNLHGVLWVPGGTAVSDYARLTNVFPVAFQIAFLVRPPG